MPAGFFTADELVNIEPLVPRCGQCGLDRKCYSPKMPYTGKGRRKVLIVGEAPGEQEDQQGIQFIGKSGQLLRKTLRDCGTELNDCWKTNAVCCHQPGNPAPTDKQIKACRPNVIKAIEELNPEVILLLGGTAVKSVIGRLWKEDPGPIGMWTGWRIPCQRWNCWLCPTWHPSYLLRSNDPPLDRLFRKQVEAALGLEGKPWLDGLPDYAGQVEIILDTGEAVKRLRAMVERGGVFSFDLETDRLKPDSKDARIVCCSVCRDGEETIAFPWHGEVVGAMDEFLCSDVKKIGWNIKFEERWTQRVFGHGVRGWAWDGMIAAHVLDNRKGITNAKIQAFLSLGQEPYSDKVAPYLEANGGNERNRIDRVDMRDLLLYCGLDSLLEWKIVERQRGLLK